MRKRLLLLIPITSYQDQYSTAGTHVSTIAGWACRSTRRTQRFALLRTRCSRRSSIYSSRLQRRLLEPPRCATDGLKCHSPARIARCPREVGSNEVANGAAPAADQPPSAPEYGDLQSNPDSVLARPPVSFGDATPGTQAYCKPAGGNQLGCRNGASDGRRNRDVSEQQA